MKHITLLLMIILYGCNTNKKNTAAIDFPLTTVSFEYEDVSGIGFEKGITRRDPSDVIEENGVYYVYYTKVIGRAPGYWGDIWYATSTDKGFNWKEEGKVLGVGVNAAFDSQAVFTPNIIKAKDNYYLFYTGVKPTPGRTDGVFENNSTTDITALGLAIAKSPDGPFKRLSNEPVMEISNESEQFDSYRIDDASLLYSNNKYYLYYKGRSSSHGTAGPKSTKMGVAIASYPEGPFVKLEKPVLSNSHEVMIWKQGKGVAALASISSTLEYAEDGLDFTTNQKNIKVENRPNAPGAFRADLTGSDSKELDWGISMIHNGPDCYLVRFKTDKITTNTK